MAGCGRSPLTAITARAAGAPVSWGACEVPGWGPTAPPAEVLAEMTDLGLTMTELGPIGYLGGDVAQQRRLLDSFGLRAVGRFVPLVLHRGRESHLDRALDPQLRELERLGASHVVIAVLASPSWDEPALSPSEWDTVLVRLCQVRARAEGRGLTMALHPHAGTVIEAVESLERVLAHTDVQWCLDPGHLELGGADALDLLERHGGRVSLVHLKDVNASLACEVRERRLSLRDATARGLFPVLGAGDARIAELMRKLDRCCYSGPLVIEQDRVLGAGGPGQLTREMLDSLAYLRSLEGVLGHDRRTEVAGDRR